MLPIWLTDTITSDLDRALHYTMLWGFEGVELRTVGGASDLVPFVNEEKLRRRLSEHDVPVVSVVPGYFMGAASDKAGRLNDGAQLEETLDFCRRIGCDRVVVSAFTDVERHETDAAVAALHRAGVSAARKGIRLHVLNEVGMAHPTGAALGRLLDAVDHPAVYAAWDPAAALQAGEDPLEGLQALGSRVGLVRCYNVMAQGDQWIPAPLDAGGVDWPAQLLMLHKMRFDGPLSVEVHLHPGPKHGLRIATALIQMIRAARRA